jgi:hypothetical protein
MIPKNWRIKFFNWLSAGRLTLVLDNTKEHFTTMGSTYTIGGGGYNAGSISLGPTTQGPITGQTLTIKITPANGGNIVSVGNMNHDENLYIISDDADFDRELGKIITVSKLKS